RLFRRLCLVVGLNADRNISPHAATRVAKYRTKISVRTRHVRSNHDLLSLNSSIFSCCKTVCSGRVLDLWGHWKTTGYLAKTQVMAHVVVHVDKKDLEFCTIGNRQCRISEALNSV